MKSTSSSLNVADDREMAAKIKKFYIKINTLKLAPYGTGG